MTSVSLSDSEDKIIERLGDCDKVHVDYMDLLSHRVRCRKIEIFHFDDKVSFTPNDDDAEEEELGLSIGQLFSEDRTDDEDRTRELVGGVDCLIRRIEQMQLIVKQRKVDTETDLESVSRTEKEEGEQLPEEEELEVRDLEHAHGRIQCEIDEMICNYRLMRGLLAQMRHKICRENRRVRQLSDLAEKCGEWSQRVAQELPVCRERYQRMLETKLSKTEAKDVIRANVAKARKYSETLLTNRQLRFELREFRAEIDELLEYADDLRREMSRRFASIERETGLTATNNLSQSSCPKTN